MHKCYACGRSGHFARDKMCLAKGKLSAKCSKRGHWAACCRNEVDGKEKLSKSDGGESESNDWRSCGAVGRFPKVFSGVGKLSGYQLKLHINRANTPKAQKPRRIPYPLKDKVHRKIDELLNLNIIEKVSGQTTWVSQVIAPKPSRMMCVYALTLGVPKREKHCPKNWIYTNLLGANMVQKSAN